MHAQMEARGDDDVDATRRPECVDRVWDEQVDGAWAPGKAPVRLLTMFLQCVQERNSAEAERTASEILEMEPNNRLVQDLLAAMKQQEAMESEEEDDSTEEEDGDEEEGDSSEEDKEESEESEEEEEDRDVEAKASEEE